jgi:(2Fe-2S) ferredoxin
VVRVHERTIQTERPPLVGEVNANFCRLTVPCIAKCPHGCVLIFLDRSRYFFHQVAPHEAEWTPFQSHYSENLVESRIETGPVNQ